MIYCCSNPNDGQHIIEGKFSNKIGFNIRPYTEQLLEKLSELYEIVVFTASEQYYADPIINFLDPSGKYISHRLYRRHCFRYGQFFVKDLRILDNVLLQDLIIVDNHIYSFGFQLDNGVPVNTWERSKEDDELSVITDYLMFVVNSNDLRSDNRKTFRLIEAM